MNPRTEELAWAAGFFEGEGTITLSDGRLHVRIGNTDEEMSRRFAEIMPVGSLYGPYPPYGGSERRKKLLWVWIARDEAGLDALTLMWTWLGTRRRQRAQQVTGIRFPVFFRAAKEMLAEESAPRLPPPPAAGA